MADETVSLLFEAREELSKTLKRVDKALDGVRNAASQTAGSMSTLDGVSDRTEEELEQVGDEASQATVKISTLHSALAGFSTSKFDLTKEVPIEIDDKSMEEGAVKADELAQRVELALKNTEMDIDPELDTDELLKELEETTGVASNLQDDLRVGIEVSQEELVEETRESIQEAESASGAVDVNINVPEGVKAEFITEVRTLIETAQAATGDVHVNIDLDATDEAVQLASLVAGMNAAKISALETAAATNVAEGQIDEMGDEAAEGTAKMGGLASAMNIASLNTTALSFNIGMFNIALGNLATQIPILVGLIGTLGATIAGVAGAALLATGGIGAFIGAGFVSELGRIEEQFAGVESKAEAMQAIMQSLVSEFEKAIEPLTEMGEAGNLFFGAINSILETVNFFAKSIANSFEFTGQQMNEFIETGKSMGIIGEEMSDSEAADEIMSLGEFIDEVGDIFGRNADDIMSAFQVMAAFLLPVLADIIQFFVSGFDDMILFVTKLTTEMAKLGPVFSSFIDFAVEIINLASTILTGLLPVFVGLIQLLTGAAEILNSLNNELIRNIAAFALLAKTAYGVGKSYVALKKAIWEVIAASSLDITKKKLQAFWTAVVAMETWALGAALLFTVGALAGVLLVGGALLALFTQMGGVTSGLKEMFAALKRVVMAVVEVFVNSFVSVGNSIMRAFEGVKAAIEPFIRLAKMIGLVDEEAGALGITIGILKGFLAAVLYPFEILYAIFGEIIYVVGQLVGLIVGGFVAYFRIVMDLVTALIDGFMGLWNALKKALGIGGSSVLKTLLSKIGGFVDTIVSGLQNLPKLIRDLSNFLMRQIETMVNFIVGVINSFIKHLNKVLPNRFEIDEVGEVDLTKETEAIKKDDLSGDTDDAEEEVTPEQPTNFTYNEENINNVAQDINADPEETESLRRVVKDAMEEADAFTRRTQGG